MTTLFDALLVERNCRVRSDLCLDLQFQDFTPRIHLSPSCLPLKETCKQSHSEWIDDPAMASKTLINVTNASLRRSRDSPIVIEKLSLRINAGNAYVICGPINSGKSTILDAIRGHLPVHAGSLTYPFLNKTVWPSEVIKLLSSTETASGGAAYYSERYHSRREDDYTLRTWLNTFASGRGANIPSMKDLIQETSEKLDLVDYLDRSMMNLSNGQAKRANIAKVLLSRPRVLLLDEPYIGLDVDARKRLSEMLGRFVATQSPNIVLALRPVDDLPSWATHMLWLNADGTTRYVGTIKDILHEYELEQEQKRRAIKGQQQERQEVHNSTTGETLVELNNVGINYSGKSVLEEITWQIRAGEKWRLSGPNGSGKTTLLSLITGDHPKIYANQVHLFGQRRNHKDGRSIFEIQKEMGHTSPEIHKHYPRFRTGAECIASGFSENFHPPRSLTATQEAGIDAMVEYFDVQRHVSVPLSDMAPPLQRLFLLLRALVKRPKLLILDEPFAGMDESFIMRAKQYIDSEVGAEQAVVFVSHYDDEVPASVRRHLALKSGRIDELL